MRTKLCVALTLFLLASCSGVHLVSDYDEVIDKGIMEFAEQFSAHVKNMGDLAGEPAGTYAENIKTYNALDAKLDVLIARASAASDGQRCGLAQKVFDRVKSIMQTNLPADVQAASSSQSGASEACNARLLVLVKDQLAYVRTIHRTTDKCGRSHVSCIRPATAGTALAIANQSINAVAVVENAKK